MAESIRVLHVIKGLGPGGAERLLVSMAAAADPNAVRYEVAYVLPWKQHLVPALEALGVPTHLLGGAGGMADPRWATRLRRLAIDARPDIVHVHSPAVAAITRPVLAALKRSPLLVSTEHNVWASHGRVTRVANALTMPLDAVRWGVSDEVVASVWPRLRRGMEVLVHGVPVAALAARRAERAAARSACGWDVGDIVVAHVANLRANKDHSTLFRAAALAIAEEPTLRFASIGQGPLEAQLRDELAGFGLGDRFTLLGYHADPPAVVAGADMFTLSSVHEGLPVSLVEAMALGLPPVVTDVGGVSQVVTDGVDGVLVPPRDPNALAAAYVRLTRNAELRRSLGDAAALRAADFDIGRTARIVEDRYRLELAAR